MIRIVWFSEEVDTQYIIYTYRQYFYVHHHHECTMCALPPTKQKFNNIPVNQLIGNMSVSWILLFFFYLKTNASVTHIYELCSSPKQKCIINYQGYHKY